MTNDKLRVLYHYKGTPIYGTQNGDLYMRTWRLFRVTLGGSKTQVGQFYSKETAEAALARRQKLNTHPRITFELWECPPGWAATAQ